MSSDRHPLLKRAQELDGWSQHADVDPNDFISLQKYKMLLHPPENRARALHEIDAAIDASEGGNLRQTSDLVRLRRELSKTHEELLKAGR